MAGATGRAGHAHTFREHLVSSLNISDSSALLLSLTSSYSVAELYPLVVNSVVFSPNFVIMPLAYLLGFVAKNERTVLEPLGGVKRMDDSFHPLASRPGLPAESCSY